MLGKLNANKPPTQFLRRYECRPGTTERVEDYVARRREALYQKRQDGNVESGWLSADSIPLDCSSGFED
jgi:hypothetical protein